MTVISDVPLLPKSRMIKPVKTVRVERTPDEWAKLINEAKKKEGFWTRGIIPGRVDLAKIAGYMEFDDD